MGMASGTMFVALLLSLMAAMYKCDARQLEEIQEKTQQHKYGAEEYSSNFPYNFPFQGPGNNPGNPFAPRSRSGFPFSFEPPPQPQNPSFGFPFSFEPPPQPQRPSFGFPFSFEPPPQPQLPSFGFPFSFAPSPPRPPFGFPSLTSQTSTPPSQA